MNTEELEKKWEETAKAAFDAFIRDNIGYKSDSDQPTCFGTGDERKYCLPCPYKRTC
jgi:hypothetical protein